MKRRDFFKSLSGAVAGIYLAVGAELIHRKNPIPINPEWLDAEYAIYFPGLVGFKTFNRSPWIDLLEPGEFPALMGETTRPVL